MTRRTRLPGADELFRSTGSGSAAGAAAAIPAEVERGRAEQLLAERPDPAPQPDERDDARSPQGQVPVRATGIRRRAARNSVDRRPTGRERHDEKITVYVSAEELLDLEHARLTLRGDHGLAVDRGRIVREALAVVLADLDAKGDSSILVRRLRGA
jgi:hypothetical protein